MPGLKVMMIMTMINVVSKGGSLAKVNHNNIYDLLNYQCLKIQQWAILQSKLNLAINKSF
jgi:hypothetical protein